MATFSLELPAETFSALHLSPDEFVRELRLAGAIHWYKRGEISQEKAASLADLDQKDFLLALKSEQVNTFNVDFADLRLQLERG
ncbi:Uncharacterized protein family (UPF0175) [Cylindrospermum stagnale PCC 7417]|uniref:Uncharacterized protein family (UPF0175) n=1 Tax=Cylindrospermum stagnale PCC 7417 TaxID=56107 RepID=K9X1U4_9NOST|nr:UPF0175 family protein [Cylindrospermum stagnale]AFZ26016.1 Uncharacterized protein family (UPF0175) [Cylindrospermum stagnale PCC 7417]